MLPPIASPNGTCRAFISSPAATAAKTLPPAATTATTRNCDAAGEHDQRERDHEDERHPRRGGQRAERGADHADRGRQREDVAEVVRM